MGLGGAGRAGAVLNDSIYLNPSYLGLLRAYSIQGDYLWFKGDAHGKNLNVSVLDGTSELFSAGLAYTVREDFKHFQLGLGRALIPAKLSVGLGGKLVIPKQDLANGIDVSVSATYVFSPMLQAAIIADNLLETQELEPWNMPREISAGGKLNIQNIFITYLDPHWAPGLETDAWGYNLGLEFMLMTDLSFKLGSFVNSQIPHLGNARGDGYSTGAGWFGPRIALDFAIMRALNPVAITTYNSSLTISF
jgi:hypothetical protein